MPAPAPPMTRQELFALPTVVSLDTASHALGLGRTKGQQLARSGKYPVRVLASGNRRKVASADLLAYLGLMVPEAPAFAG